MDNQIRVMDSGSACLPPSLATSDVTAEKVTLQSLIDEWRSYMGMITAFEKDSPLICFQIDRFCSVDQGNAIKAAWHLELTEVEILISSDDNLRTEVFSYLPSLADWICVWLIRAPRCRTVTPSFYVRGHASKVHQLVQFLDSRNW